jgi:hypothetical protein
MRGTAPLVDEHAAGFHLSHRPETDWSACASVFGDAFEQPASGN